MADDDEPALAELLAAARDPDPEERLWAAEHLGPAMDDDDPAGVAELVALCGDRDVRVRDWATFALGQLTGQDTPAVQTALAERLHDEDEVVRSYALHGLAVRRDRRAWPLMIEAFRGDRVQVHLFRAAAYLREPALAPLLREFDDPDGTIATALAECDPRLRAARDDRVLRVIDLIFARAPEYDPAVYCERYGLDLHVTCAVWPENHVADIPSMLRAHGDDPERTAERIIAAFRSAAATGAA